MQKMACGLIIVIMCLCNNYVFCEIPIDIETCVEDGKCGIKSIGSYNISYSINSTLSKNVNTSSKHYLYSTGYLYEIRNGLMYDINFYWDVVSHFSQKLQSSGISNENTKIKIYVPSLSYRYIDSEIINAHIVRLFIHDESNNEYEAIDKSIGNENLILSNKKSVLCDYFFRKCYLDKKYDHETNCSTYESFCDNFYKKRDDDICIDTCITTYYGHLLNDHEKIAPNFNRQDLVKCIIDHQRTSSIIGIYSDGINTNNNYYLTTKSTEKQNLETTITVLSIILAVVFLFLIISLFYWIRHVYNKKKKSKNLDSKPIMSENYNNQPPFFTINS